MTRARCRRDGRTSTALTALRPLVIAVAVTMSAAGLAACSSTTSSQSAQGSGTTPEAAGIVTAQAAYCAKNGTYGSVDDLVAGGFLSGKPTEVGVVKTTSGSCGGTGFVVGSPTFTPSSGPRVLAASNTTAVFSFLAQSFIDANSAIQFSFGGSGTLAETANSAAEASTDVLFASADEGNVNKTIAAADPVAAGSEGKCTGTCTGIGSTKTHYTNGRLAVYSCKDGATSLPPAEGTNAQCKAPANGFVAAPPTTVTEVVTLLRANKAVKLAIANPGDLPPNPKKAPTAPYGVAAYEALTSTAAGGGGLSAADYAALVDAGQIVYGKNVGATQTLVQTGAVDIALLPKSFQVSPAGDDTNNWTTIDAALHTPIRQWAVVLNHGTDADQALGKKFLEYVTSPTGQSVLAAFGYDPVR